MAITQIFKSILRNITRQKYKKFIKMKVLIALTIFVVLAVEAAVNREQVQQQIKTASDNCLNDPAVGVSKDELKAFRESKGPKPANIGKLSVCVLKGIGWMKADNTLKTSEIRELFKQGLNGDLTKLEEVMGKCVADKGTPEETANNLLECLVFHGRNRQAASTA
ncbi:uncharacterized protein LOC126742949 [Anthonomus grandis grandis]|uniref:uncharacterized protein LOC126742949 n=1 Tax=Anthonomus grandis grandis TaxID=2921223 RepID=UPI0021658445|nr:uncharacterized protein LOC126742949 [Anthonomus grandis grandis]